MGFYFRKSISVGPFRFNLSKSGIGVSTGIPGLRIGTGPRGTYIHAGKGGLYYRKTLSAGNGKRKGTVNTVPLPVTTPPAVPLSVVPPVFGSSPALVEIESGSVLRMTDSSSADLLTELNKKRRAMRFWPAVAAMSIGVGLAFPPMLLVGFAATAACYWWDMVRKTAVLMYELEPEAADDYNALHEAFEALAAAKGQWHIAATQEVLDRKRHAGAADSVKRTAIRLSKAAPRFVKTNIEVPMISAGQQSLYFFPDRLFIFDGDGVGAVAYSDLTMQVRTTNFIEEERVPEDTQVVGSTWKYLNKDGGPDRRFSDNRQIPIVLYDQIWFGSRTGLNEIVQISRVGPASQFAHAVRSMATQR